MALRENEFNRSYNPNDQDRQAPDQNEFEIIQNLYAVERKGSPELKSAYVEMPKTEVAQTRILHKDTTNDGGRIFGGSLINQAIQVAILSIVELCELSLLDGKDEDGNPLPPMRAVDTIKHVNLVQMEICKFISADIDIKF